MVAVILRGDRDLNEIKLKNFLNCQQLFMADEQSVREQCGAGFGSLGPVELKARIYIDSEANRLKNFSCGANQDGFHYINCNVGRDFVPTAVGDFKNAVEGDPCPDCGGMMRALRGIEVGHIFKLGTKYSDALQAFYRNREGEEKPFVMGCYGMGVTRTMAAAVEQNHDDNGIIWPMPIAPYQVIIIPVNVQKDDQMQAAAKIYQQLSDMGLEVVLDDRDERAGVKFKDADLIGIPIKVTIGPKALQENQVEVKKRWETAVARVEITSVADYVQTIVKEGLA